MAPRKSSLDTEIRQLFELPLAQFTPARDALAKRLRQEKQSAEAKQVKALAKPTPSAWAVNLLLAREPEKMAELVAAGRRARVAQREAVSGRGAQALKDAIRAARALADELRWEAGKLAAEEGRAPGRTMVERIAANLQALAFDPEAKDVIARGWLERDLEPPGFEVLTGLVVAGAPVVDLAARREARRPAEREAEEEPAAKEEKRETQEPEKKAAAPRPAEAPAPEQPSAREKRQEEATRRREANEAARREREAEARRRQVEAAEEKVERARAEAESLREEAGQAEKAAAAALRAAQAADRAAETAHEKAEKAAERLAQAHRELGEVQKRG